MSKKGGKLWKKKDFILSYVPNGIGAQNIGEHVGGYAQMDCHMCGYSGCPHDMMQANIMNQKERQFNNIGSMGSGFEVTNKDNITLDYDLGNMLKDDSLTGICLSERYDASFHNESPFHLNQDITGKNSGTSKKNEDGWKGLGPAHKIYIPK